MAFTQPASNLYRATSADGAVAETISLPTRKSAPYLLTSVKYQTDGTAQAENFTITMDAAAGALFDFTLHTVAMSGLAGFTYSFDPPLALNPGDDIDFAFANTSDDAWGLEVHIE